MDLNTIFEILFGLTSTTLAIFGLILTYKYREGAQIINISFDVVISDPQSRHTRAPSSMAFRSLSVAAFSQ